MHSQELSLVLYPSLGPPSANWYHLCKAKMGMSIQIVHSILLSINYTHFYGHIYSDTFCLDIKFCIQTDTIWKDMAIKKGALKQGPCTCSTFKAFIYMLTLHARTNVPLSSAQLPTYDLLSPHPMTKHNFFAGGKRWTKLTLESATIWPMRRSRNGGRRILWPETSTNTDTDILGENPMK